jgi:ABC-type Zn uptake system ZnuABC Zn-binding protein ZnuA
VGVVQPVPGSEPQPDHLQTLLGELRAIEPAALFSEPQLDDQQALALAREAGILVRKVDALGGTPEALSYETLVRGIARAMDEALR